METGKRQGHMKGAYPGICRSELDLIEVYKIECAAMLPIDQIREEIEEAVKEPGFCVLLSAPTGSGKSTLLALLMRIRAPSGSHAPPAPAIRR